MTAGFLQPRAQRSEAVGITPSPAVRALGYGLLAALAYIPLLLTSPGKVVADTKSYLYLDPGRLLERAPLMWSPNIGMGTLTHQQIGYLWPMGPYYWITDTLGVPAWVAQRLWLGTILLLAALGVRYLLRTLHVRGPGVPVAMVLFMLSPYILNFAARNSVLLLPWAGLPWMLALTIRALRDHEGRGWTYPALFAVVVVTVGSINLSALVFVGVAPVLWIVYAVVVTHEVSYRRAVATALKIGGLSFAVSLWWIWALVVESRYGTNLLLFTETFETVAQKSSVPEVLRGLGYWFSYGRDKISPLTESTVAYQENAGLIALSFSIPVLAVFAAAWIRWRHRMFFVLLIFVGVVIAVSAHPYDSPTALGSIWKSVVAESGIGLALRNTPRAIPMITLGFAALVATAVNAVAARWTARGVAVRGLVLAALLIALVVATMPPLFDDTMYTKSLLRDENVPEYWTEAIAELDAQPHDTRILEIPGADFVYHRWGATLDPITPFLTDRPYVAREQVAFGSAASLDLLRALDNRLQEGVLEQDAIAPMARLLSVGDVVYRADLQTDRYDLAAATPTWVFLTEPGVAAGLDEPITYGDSLGPPLEFPKVNEVVLALPAGTRDPAPVSIFRVQDTTSIVRAASSQGALVVSGDGAGLVDLATIGVLDDTNRVILYSGSYAGDKPALRDVAARNDAVLVVTDSNRKRAERWGTINAKTGATERVDAEALRTDETDQRLEVFPGQGTDAQTVILAAGAKVTASRYGGDFILEPELRPSRAFDGDPATSWQAGFHSNVIGDRIRLDLTTPITTEQVRLVQPQIGAVDRFITRVTLTFDGGHPLSVDLTEESRGAGGQTVTFPRRTFERFEVTVDDTNVANEAFGELTNNVGFAEIVLRDDAPGSQDIKVDEIVRMPTDLVDTVAGDAAGHPLVYSMRRSRTNVIPPKFSQDELALVRQLRVPDARTFGAGGAARVATDAPDDVVDAVLGLPDAARGGLTVRASVRLPGSVAARGSAAFDGDAATAWSTAFFTPQDQWVEFDTPNPVTIDRMNLQVVADGRHSVPTQIRLDAGNESRVIDLPAIDDSSEPNATVTVPVSFDPMTVSSARVTITQVRATLTTDYYCECDIPMPVAIAEFGIPGVQRAQMGAQLPATCRTDLLTVDGRALGVRIVGSTSAAEDRQAVDLQLCDPSDATVVPAISLAAGDHVVRTQPGKFTGIDFDRFVLAAGGSGNPMMVGPRGSLAAALRAIGPSAVQSAPAVRLTEDGATEIELEVRGAQPGTPFWLVLGQSQNRGWKATVAGQDLGTSSLVQGYANGWLVDPQRENFSITLAWTPQRDVWIAIAISCVALLLCAFVVARTVRRRRQSRDGDPVARDEQPEDAVDGAVTLANPLVADGVEPSRTVLVVAPLAAAITAALVSRWWIGILAGVGVVAVLLRPRLRGILSIGAPIALAAVGAYVAIAQFRNDYIAEFVWPEHFGRVNDLAWLAVVLLACDAVVEVLRTRPWVRGSPETDGIS